MNERNTVHLALTFDQNFIVPFYVAITSIFENNKENSFFFHVIATGLSQEEKSDIELYIIKNRSEINFYEIDIALAESFPIYSPHFTAATYYRLFLPALIPSSISKLLYLDVDIVVSNDLRELYELGIKDFVVAAALDPGIKSRPELGIVQEDAYFNAGIMLINIKRWIEQEITDKAIKYMMDYPERIMFADQDAMNAVLIGKWLKIDKKFNLQRGDTPNLSKKKLKHFIADKIIIHYTSSDKPWNIFCTHPLKYLYDFYLSKSPKSLSNQYSSMKLFKHVVISYFANTIISFYTSNPTILNAWRRLRS